MKTIAIFISGIVFGFGLGLSGMFSPEVVLSFLQLKDFGLLLVLLPAAIITGLAIQILKRTKLHAPLTQLPYGSRNYHLGRNTILGGVFFGIGWGLSGVCPGAAFASLGGANFAILWALLGMALGSLAFHYILNTYPKWSVCKDYKK